MPIQTGQKKTAVTRTGGLNPASRVRTNRLTNRSDDEDEAAELMRELEKIKKERLEQKEKEVCRFLTP
jgi:hypothetical protein